MIIFGTRTKTVTSGNAPVFNCSHCGSAGAVQALKSFKYFHIFWIPFFAYSNSIITQCAHCKKVQYQNEIERNELNSIKSAIHAKIPWKYYSGLILISVFFLFVIFSVVSTRTSISKHIKNPEVDDVYEMRLKKEGKTIYTLYRIADVTADSVTFEMNDYEVTSVTKLDDLQRAHKNDYTEKITVPLAELTKWEAERRIRDIDKAEIK